MQFFVTQKQTEIKMQVQLCTSMGAVGKEMEAVVVIRRNFSDKP